MRFRFQRPTGFTGFASSDAMKTFLHSSACGRRGGSAGLQNEPSLRGFAQAATSHTWEGPTAGTVDPSRTNFTAGLGLDQ